jgi:methylglutaconyl-CoA hydratase
MVAPYVVNAIGPRAAKALFTTGRTFDAAHALAIGLVQEVVEGTEGLAAAQERIAGDILQSAPEAVRLAKALAWEVWGRPIDRDLTEDCARRLAKRRVSEEGREGVAAAVEGRLPIWAQ